MNDVNVMNGQLNNKIYILSQSISVMYISDKHPRIDDVTDIYLWHYRLGYINKNRINMLAQEKMFEVSNCESLSTCEFCLLRKIIKSPFTEKGERASEVLDLIHIDICGSMNTNIKIGRAHV